MKFTFEVEAENFGEAAEKLIQAMNAPKPVDEPKQTTKTTKKADPAPQAPAQETASEQNTTFNFGSTESATEGKAPAVTKEMVRAKWSAISQSGYQAKLKEVLQSYGVAKLLDIPEEHYPALVEKANEFVKTIPAGDLSPAIKKEFGL
jgi:hypothetical protein